MNLQGSRTRARQERQNERFLTTGPNCRADTDSDPPCPSPNALQPPPQTHHPSHPRSLALPQPHALHTTTLSSRTLRRTLRNRGTPPPVLPAVQTVHLDDRVLLRQPDVSRRGGGWGDCGTHSPDATRRGSALPLATCLWYQLPHSARLRSACVLIEETSDSPSPLRIEEISKRVPFAHRLTHGAPKHGGRECHAKWGTFPYAFWAWCRVFLIQFLSMCQLVCFLRLYEGLKEPKRSSCSLPHFRCTAMFGRSFSIN